MRARNNLRVAIQGKEFDRGWGVGVGNPPRMMRVAKGVGGEVRVGRLSVVVLPQIGGEYPLHSLVFCPPGQRSRVLWVRGKSKREG